MTLVPWSRAYSIRSRAASLCERQLPWLQGATWASTGKRVMPLSQGLAILKTGILSWLWLVTDPTHSRLASLVTSEAGKKITQPWREVPWNSRPAMLASGWCWWCCFWLNLPKLYGVSVCVCFVSGRIFVCLIGWFGLVEISFFLLVLFWGWFLFSFGGCGIRHGHVDIGLQINVAEAGL